MPVVVLSYFSTTPGGYKWNVGFGVDRLGGRFRKKIEKELGIRS